MRASQPAAREPCDRVAEPLLDPEDPVEAGDLERPQDPAIVRDEHEIAAARPKARLIAEQQAEHGRVDEPDLGEVDDDRVAAELEHLHELSLHLGAVCRSTSPLTETTKPLFPTSAILTSNSGSMAWTLATAA